MRARLSGEFGFALILAAIAVFFLVSAATYSSKARMVPLIIGIPTFTLAVVQIVRLLRSGPADHSGETIDDDDEPAGSDEGVTTSNEIKSVAWVVGCFAAIYVFGFMYGLPAYAFLYAKLRGREGWLLSLIPAAVAFAVLYGVFNRGLHVPLHEGVLIQLLGG